MVAPEQLLTVEAFWRRYAGMPYELVRGRVVKVSPAGGEAPEVGLMIGAAVLNFVLKHRLGKVTNAEGGYWLAADTLRAPDVAFYNWEKHRLHTDRDQYRPFPPDLAVEVVAPTDKAEDIHEKVKLYLAAGVLLIWVVYPRTREVMVYRPDEQPERLTATDTLTGGDVLPGFTLAVADCFPPSIPE
jgi:Uma2 family endonuclease